ncbi:hypothetical protein SAMN06269185_0844 [Natronoarchaeum philippinense]|uniref:DUF7344 domain-containing protein n=1 Tax=Natronoarchaeum philippinense TaxID=558529 RepID=A0A285N7U1_NATPI|nr:hypothetical protein SAMN06269185_0844 [Natronoarchaeum philippinense]
MTQLSTDGLDLSPDQVYDVLGHPYRRHTLCVLHSRPGSVDLTELATAVSARCDEQTPVEVDDTERHTVLVELHHNHVPRLRSVGLVAYNPAESGAVELVGDIEPLLPTLRSEDDDLQQYRLD